jgi:hypothetical protein
MSDWSKGNGFTPYKPRRDLIVLERPGGELVVKKRRRRRPRPQRAVAVIKPHVTILPPARPSLRITVTHTRYSVNPDEERVYVEGLSDPGLSFLTALFNFLSSRR